MAKKKLEIKRGMKFECIDDFYMNDGELAFEKGKVYVSEKDKCLTDDIKEHNWLSDEHEMESLGSEFFEYFKEVRDEKEL